MKSEARLEVARKKYDEAFRKKYADLIKWSDQEPIEIVSMLGKGIEAGDEKCLEALGNLAERALKELVRVEGKIEGQTIQFSLTKVRGMASAVGIINECLVLLDRLMRKHPALLLPLTRKSPSWPILVSRRAAHRKEQINFLIKQMHLGEDYRLNVIGKTPFSKEFQIARRLYDHVRLIYQHPFRPGKIADRARALTPLSKSNYRKWWSVARMVLEDECGKEFWRHEMFAYWLTEKAAPKYSFDKPGALSNAIVNALKREFRLMVGRGGRRLPSGVSVAYCTFKTNK